jgi:hypothetical protein
LKLKKRRENSALKGLMLPGVVFINARSFANGNIDQRFFSNLQEKQTEVYQVEDTVR